jgi:Phage integrase family
MRLASLPVEAAARGGEGGPPGCTRSRAAPAHVPAWAACIGSGQPQARPCERAGEPNIGQAREGLLDSQQPLTGNELRALKRCLATREDRLPWLFVSAAGGQPHDRGGGKRAGLGNVHPHMLRHSCGYASPKKGQDFRPIQDWLGHRDPKHTSRYTALRPGGLRACGNKDRP